MTICAGWVYETVDTSTTAGFERAEYLSARGWACTVVGIFKLQFWTKTGV